MASIFFVVVLGTLCLGAGFGIFTILSRSLPRWAVIGGLIAVCVVVVDIAMVRSFLGIDYGRLMPSVFGSTWSFLGKIIVAIACGGPFVLGAILGASLNERSGADSERS